MGGKNKTEKIFKNLKKKVYIFALFQDVPFFLLAKYHSKSVRFFFLPFFKIKLKNIFL
jgi:hypothetical protein